MPFVLDASIAACWAFADEDHPVAALALERIRGDEARVPGLWWFEVRNVLIVNERRGRLAEADTAAFLRWIARLGVTVDGSASMTRAIWNWRSARRCRWRPSMPNWRGRRAWRGCWFSMPRRRRNQADLAR